MARAASSRAAVAKAAPATEIAHIDLAAALRALDNDRRLQIFEWLKTPTAHFGPQVDGDLEKDGVCGASIAEKAGISQPTLSEHMRVLVTSGLVSSKRVKQWTFYKRDAKMIAAFLRVMRDL
jgi:DNA-binding transcriptional ArsR family regulator